MTAAADLAVLHARQLLVIGEGRGGPRRGREQGTIDVIEDGAVLVREGRITDVGRTLDVTAGVDLSGVRVIDASGSVVLPGLIDAHTHPLFAGVRLDDWAQRLGGASLAEVAARGGGMWQTVLWTRAAEDEELLTAARSVLGEMLRSGTTTVEVKSGYGQNPGEELRQLQLIGRLAEDLPLRIVATFLGAHLVPPEYGDADKYVRVVLDEMLPAVAKQGIARFSDATCEVGFFTDGQATAILRRSAELGLPGRVHADAFAHSAGWRTAVANHAASADHLTYTPDDEIEAVGAADTVAVLIPTAELYYFADRRANARKLIQSGVPVALATDFCSSIHTPSLYQTLPLGAAWFRLTPEEALSAVTVNAAWSLRILHEVGTLEPGKWADFIVVDVPDYRMLVYELGVTRVTTVVVGGRVVVGE